MVDIKDLTKYYGTKAALKNIDLHLGGGEIIGLFGENGAGKTTLMKCILGFLPYKGEILFEGEPISKKNIAKISFATSEHSFFPDITAKGHMLFYKEHFERFNEKRFIGLMEFFELPMNKNIRFFSTGQKNQFEVILALSQGANLIIMDEPFAGNDIFNREDFYKVLLGILEPEETILLSTHLIEEVSSFISRAILIKKGCIIADVKTEDLEAVNTGLVDYIKERYRYSPSRVGNALSEIRGEEE